jgi:septal ring factor EnvC (AmiA/AmiB activator)
LIRKGSFVTANSKVKFRIRYSVIICKQLILLLVFILAAANLKAQSKKELQRKKAELEQEIANTNKQLNRTKRNKASTLNEVKMLNKKISFRNQLIQTVNKEISLVDDEMGTITYHVDSLERRMADLHKHYEQLLFFAYRNQSAYSRLSFIFSADDFNQAYKRMKYMQQLSAYRIHQRDLIKETQISLNNRKRQLTGVKTDKEQLLTVQERQKATLDKEKKEQMVIVGNLSKTEKRLKVDIQEKQKAAARLDRMIEDVIRREIETAKAAAKKKETSTLTADAKRTTAPSSVLNSTPEAIKLSTDFANNRGKLPWPVEQGFISSSYGRHAHPIWKDVIVNNSGIDIGSSKDAGVRAIFNGRVTKVLMIVNKYAVIIQHGEYFTVYSNLKEVNVKTDDFVKTKQVIGKVMTDEDEGKSEVHFEVWKGSNKMNPESWIASR